MPFRKRYTRSLFAKAPSKRRLTKFMGAIVWLAGAGVCATSLTLASVFLYLDPQIPSTDTYRNYRFETPLRIYTADEKLIAEFGRRLIPIALPDVPEHFLNALIDTEDKRFYRHGGIDFISLANDLVGLLTSDVRTGASTLTMQLAKVVSFTHRQRFIRKFKEMLLALKLEQDLNKDEILELYVNIMSFGKHAYGVQAAAYTYYGKPVDQLDLAQLAMLAGIIKKPEGGNPINGPEWALSRRNLVLRRMRAQDSIDEAAYRHAAAAPITAEVHRRSIDLPAPYPAEWVRQELFERHGQDIYSGFLAYTTLDSRLQAAAQDAVRNGLIAYDRRHGFRGREGRVELVWSTDAAGEEQLDVAAAVAALNDQYRAVEPLEPVVVTAVAEQSAEALRGNGETLTLAWDGLRWARRYIETDARGAAPKTASDVLAAGDVVRVEAHEDGWRLGQQPDVQGALVAVDANTGGVRALVGGWDFQAKQFNHALQAKRQPGSGFKPFVYSAALESGVTPATVFWDSPLVFDDDNLETAYRPRNDSGDFRGPMRLRQALYQSRNLVSMRVMLHVGEEHIRHHVGRFGFDAEGLPRTTQLAIGGGEMAVTPLDMANAYAVLANGGFRVTPHIIERLELLDGTALEMAEHPVVCAEGCEACCGERCEDCKVPPLRPTGDAVTTPASIRDDDAKPPAPRVLDARNAFVMDSMLRDVIRLGTGRRARALNRPDIAGKTGTTDEATDTWFNGYHPNLAVSVWVGFPDGKPLGQAEYGSNTPLPIWIDFMREALSDVPVVERLMPAGVVSAKVAPESGQLAAAGDSEGIFEYFFEESAPQRGETPSVRRGAKTVRPEDIF